MGEYNKVVRLLKEYVLTTNNNDKSKSDKIAAEIVSIGEKIAEDGGYSEMYEMQCDIYDTESSMLGSLLGDIWGNIDEWRRQGY